MMPIEYTFSRYLAAKKSVDNRALNQHVWESLKRFLPPSSPEKPLRVLEIGAGVGTMIERMLSWNLLGYASYTAVDESNENINYAKVSLLRWAIGQGYPVHETPHGLAFTGQDQLVSVELEVSDIFDFAARERGRQNWDLLVAHAFLDLMDIPASLPVLFNMLRSRGLFYFTINFDGVSILEPAIDPPFDEAVQSLYHRTMDERLTKGKLSGDSRAGRHLFSHLRNAGAQVIDTGASDWVVFPGSDGYPADEAYFLHFIVHTIHQALRNHPDLDARRFYEWIVERHAQIERSELVYIAHQIDFVGIRPA